MATKPTTLKPTASKTAKPAAGKPGARAAAKPGTARKFAKPAAGGAADTSKVDLSLRLKGLVEGVTETTGMNKKDVKTVIEAALLQIGAVLARGESINLPGLGRIRVARKGTTENAAMTLKLRQGDGGKGKGKSAEADDKEPLAEDSDQG